MGRWLSRLLWYVFVLAAVLFVVALGLLTYALGGVQLGPRELPIIVGGLVATVVIVVVYAGGRLVRALMPVRTTQQQSTTPWYQPLATIPDASPLEAEYPMPPEGSTPPHGMMPLATVFSSPAPVAALSDTQPLKPLAPAAAIITLLPGEAAVTDTRRMQPVSVPVSIPEPASDSVSASMNTEPIRMPNPFGQYDHLFPPAQPGDEDYLETTQLDMDTPSSRNQPEAAAKENSKGAGEPPQAGEESVRPDITTSSTVPPDGP